MTPEQSIRFRSCLCGTGLVLFPLLLAGAAAALPYTLEANGTAYNATGIHPWENVTAASLTLTPAQVNGTWPRPSVADGNGSVLYSFANTTAVRATTTVSVEEGEEYGNIDSETARWLGTSTFLLVNFTWPCGAEDGLLEVGSYIFEGGGTMNFNGVAETLLGPWTQGAVNWTTLPANGSAFWSGTINATPARIPVNSSMANGVMLKHIPPDVGRGRLVDRDQIRLVANVTRLCAQTTLSFSAPRLPLNVTTTGGNLTASGTIQTDAVWVRTAATVEGAEVAGTYSLRNASRGNLTFSGLLGEWRKVLWGNYEMGTLFGGLGCQGGNQTVLALPNGTTLSCVIIASPPSPVNRPSSAGTGGGGGAPYTATPSPPEPGPVSQGVPAQPGSGGSSSCASCRVLSLPTVSSVAVAVSQQYGNGVEARGVPQYWLLEIPELPPGTPMEVPAYA